MINTSGSPETTSSRSSSMCSSRMVGNTVTLRALVEEVVEASRCSIRMLDGTVEEHCQFATDRETKAGPAIFSGCPCVGLLEGLEYQLLFLRRNPDARILYGESNHV